MWKGAGRWMDSWNSWGGKFTPAATSAASPSVPKPHSLTPVAQADPLVRKQRVQELMARIRGPYNFIQDSMLNFENQTLDPAIVSAQPMNPAQNMDIPQLVCPPVHSESRLAQPNQVSVQPEATQVLLVSSTSRDIQHLNPCTNLLMLLSNGHKRNRLTRFRQRSL